MYDGKIKHHRTRNSRKRLQIKGIQGIKPVNIIKFPVSKYESIYRAKRLSGKSNYQIYSALFMYEFIDYIQKNYRVKDDEQKLSVGIIAPYKAQADLIEKLLVNSCFSKNFLLRSELFIVFRAESATLFLFYSILLDIYLLQETYF